MSDQKQKVRITKIECPFDLKAVLEINLNQKGLKSVLEFILDHLGELEAKFGETEDLFSQL